MNDFKEDKKNIRRGYNSVNDSCNLRLNNKEVKNDVSNVINDEKVSYGRVRNNTSNNVKSIKKSKNFFKDSLVEYKKFYDENLKFKHIVITIIMVILFFILLKFQLDGLESVKNSSSVSSNFTAKTFWQAIVKDELLLNFIMIFAGLTPYIYVSVIGVFASYSLVLDFATAYVLNKGFFNVLIFGIGAIIQIVAYALSIATGMYFCKISTKRAKYSQVSFFGYTDFKKAIYQIRKDEKKVELMDEQKREKMEKREQYNVKVPYKMRAISFIISMVISIIGTIFLR